MSKFAFKVGNVEFKSKNEYLTICSNSLDTGVINEKLYETFEVMKKHHGKIRDEPFVLTIGYSDKHSRVKCFKMNGVDFSYKTIIDSFNNKFKNNNLKSFRECIGNEIKNKTKERCEDCGKEKDLHCHHVFSFEDMVKEFCEINSLDIDEKRFDNETIFSFKSYHEKNSILKTLCKKCHDKVHQK